MTYRIQGILKLPDGAPAANCEIEFVSRKNFSPLVQGAKTNILTSAAGAYDVTLELGEYAVILYTGGTYPAQAGTITLSADTTPGLDLPSLLNRSDWFPATPEYMQQIEAWLVSAGEYAASAEASAQSAAESAESTAGAISAHEAKAGAHSIAGVSGLQQALEGMEAAGAAESAVSAHKTESDAHAIEKITGLRGELDSLAGGLGSSGIVSHEAMRRSYAEAGFTLVDGSFEEGGALTRASDVLLHKASGIAYSWDGVFPQVVASNSTPTPLGSGGWIDRSDVALLGELAGNSGASLIGTAGGKTVRECTTLNFASTIDIISAVDIVAGDVCRSKGFYYPGDGGGWEWLAVDSASVVANGATIRQSTGSPSVSFVLIHDGVVNIRQFGCRPGYDCAQLLNSAFSDGNITQVRGVRKSFICNSKVFPKVNFNGMGAEFDFSGSPESSGSFEAYSSVEGLSLKGFSILNSKRVALIGSGDYANINGVRVKSAKLQGINWQGNDWEISDCFVDGISDEFGILNGGKSRRFKIQRNTVKNVAISGGIELGYQFEDCVVSGNAVFDSAYGYQSYPKDTNAGDLTTMNNVVFRGNTSKNISVTHYHLKNSHVADGIVVNNIRCENNNLYGGSGIGYQISSTLRVDIVGGCIDSVADKHISITGGCTKVTISGVKFYSGPASSPFIYTSQDNVWVDACDFTNGHAIIGSDAGNSFTDVIVRRCNATSVSNIHINLTELSIKSWDGNNFSTPFTSISQLSGYYPQGYKRYYTNATPGASIGVVCTTAGTYGSGAVFRSFGAIAAS